jgi:HdeA/HdeB family protein
MKRYLLILIPVCGMLLARGAVADMIDMSKLTCKQVAALEPDMQSMIGMWLSGYANGRASNTTIDSERLDKKGTELADYCTRHPDSAVMAGLDEILSGKPSQ